MDVLMRGHNLHISKPSSAAPWYISGVS